MDNLPKLSDKHTVVIFTYARAGLGHLRVTNSLSEGLPPSVSTVLLGSSDAGIEAIHRFISIHYITNALMEWVQRGSLQYLSTNIYRKLLRTNADNIYEKVKIILGERIDIPKRIVIVATHFALAHQLATVKEKLEAEEGIKVYLIVQVTDDTPQYMWYVYGADLIFVPSNLTKKCLEEYGKKLSLPHVKIEVSPYPISPILAEELEEKDYVNRYNQLVKESEAKINVCIPVSGAAVGTEYAITIMESLHEISKNYHFHVVSKKAPFTLLFLSQLKLYSSFVKTYTSTHDREVVDFYDQLYKKVVIAMEITKPSEQAFKALFRTDQAGGSILLFGRPVGRQEYDNLDFLRRYGLIFSEKERDILWDKASRNERIGEIQLLEFFEDKNKIRGMELPYDPLDAANFIDWCRRQGIFEKIGEHGTLSPLNQNIETRSDGVPTFWQRVEKLISK